MPSLSSNDRAIQIDKRQNKIKESTGFSQNGYANLTKLTNYSGMYNSLLLPFSQLRIKDIVTHTILSS